MHVLHNARIYTLDREHPFATELAIEEGYVKAIGLDDDLIPLATSKQSLFDIQGLTILPGFTDSHIHLLEYGRSLSLVNCETATKQECLARLREKATHLTSGKWILGHGWNHNIWSEGLGAKQDLDAISNQHPMYLSSKSLHSAWVNSAALQLAGIDASTPNPPGGKIVRDENGEATGILLESATSLVEDLLAAPDNEEIQQIFLSSQQALLKYGITCVHDVDRWECFSALQQLENQNQLHLRVVKSMPREQLEQGIFQKLRSGLGSDLLQIGWLKVFMDGALGTQTAAMLKSYQGNVDNCGLLLLSKSELIEIGIKALSAGIALQVHAIGDRANREALDAFELLKSIHQNNVCRNRIEHVQLIHPQDQKRLAALEIVASMQPTHVLSDMDMADKYWGKRCAYSYAWKSLLNSGAKLIFGSDAPVESPNPFIGTYAAITRKKMGSWMEQAGWYESEQIALEEALIAYIRTPSEICGLRGKTGMLKEGYFADLVVLPADPFSISAREIANLLPEATMVGGEWVWQNKDF